MLKYKYILFLYIIEYYSIIPFIMKNIFFFFFYIFMIYIEKKILKSF